MTGVLKVMQKISRYEYGVEILVLREGRNRNKWDYRNLEDCYKSLYGRPILCAFPGGRIGDGHNMDVVEDPETGERTYSFISGSSERIVGVIGGDPGDIEIRTDDNGVKWVKAKGKLFTFYARELVEKIASKGTMEVSAETEVFTTEKDGDYEVYTDWGFIGVTILGDGVAPAVPGARVRELAAMRAEFNDLCLRAAAYNNTGSDDNGEPETKPQKINSEGVTKLSRLSAKQLAQLAPKFEGYTLLAGIQGEGGLHICLLTADGSMATYTADGFDDDVVSQKITRCNAVASVAFGSECVELETDAIIDAMQAKCAELEQRCGRLSAELECKNAEIEKMRKCEEDRRTKAAVKAANATLEGFNSNREEKTGTEAIAHIVKAAEAGEFNACADNDGSWTGEETVRERVLAVCAAEVMKIDARNAAAAKTVYAWDANGIHHAAGDSTSELLKAYGID